MFDLTRIAACGLVARTDYHESIGSTSDRAIALGAQGETALPLLVLAARQTAGRGRGSNRWWTTGGALTFSLVLEAAPTQLPPERWPQVALATGIAVCDALQTLAPAAILRVKWPNDVYLTGRKVCGILSESIPGWRDRLVVGIGVNVNNRVQGSGFRVQESGPATTHHSPLTTQPDLSATATSLVDHDGVPRDITDVLIAILDQFDRRWQELLDGRFASVAAAYRQRCLLAGKTVTVQQPGRQAVVGVCSGIDDFGGLRLRTETGDETFVSGTVLRWDG